jgi:ClpP class serine protease
MSRAERSRIIGEIEKLRSSRVLSYVTGDRPPTPAQIGDDAVRPIYEQLRKMGHVPRLDVFLYSRGGAIDVPWRIATALRTASDEWNILIPFRANSAATLLALGADEIVLGRQGELGPIDPIMSIQRVAPGPGGGQGTPVQDNVNVEDVMAYVKFTRERAGLSDQQAWSPD